jgi:hypothetical protein
METLAAKRHGESQLIVSVVGESADRPHSSGSSKNNGISRSVRCWYLA